MESHQELELDCTSHESQGESGDRRSIDSVRNVLNGRIVRAVAAGIVISFSATGVASGQEICYNSEISNLTKTNMPLPKGPTQLNDNPPERQDDKKESNEDKEHEIGSDKYKSVKDNFNKLLELVDGIPERKGIKSVGVYTFKLKEGIRVKKMGSPDTLVFAIDADDNDRFLMELNQNAMAHVDFGGRFESGGCSNVKVCGLPMRGESRYWGRNESSFQAKLDQFVKLISDENAKNDEKNREKDKKEKKENKKKVKEFSTETGLE